MNIGVSQSKCGNFILEDLALPHLATTRNDKAGETEHGKFVAFSSILTLPYFSLFKRLTIQIL
jgi:hypothetical protein